MFDLKRAISASSQDFKNARQIKNARRRKSLDMFAISKQIRNSAEASMLGALDGIIFEGKS